MEIKKYLKAMPVVAALLLTVACSSEDSEIVEAPQPAQTRIVPFTATVSSGSQTRAMVDNNNNYMFQTTDKLWVWSEDGKVYGELSWKSGDEYGTTYSGTFSGNLTIAEGGSLENGKTKLYAVIKSENDVILGDWDTFKGRNYLPNYNSNTAAIIATTKEEAVQKFSFFKTESIYYTGSSGFDFSGLQNSAFISFDITLTDGSAAGEEISVSISNDNGNETRTGTVTTVEESGKVKAKFVAAFRGGYTTENEVNTYYTTLNNATVTLGNPTSNATGCPINFGGTKDLEANKVYKVSKTYTGCQITASATIPTINLPGGGTYTGGSKNMTSNNIELPYNKTMAQFLTTLDESAATLATMVTDCTKLSGDNTISITGTPYTAPSTPANYSLSATDGGTATFKVTIAGTYTIDDLSISVIKSPALVE